MQVGKVAEETGGTICELVPEKAYPDDYNTIVEQAKQEIQAGFRPELKTKVNDLASYATASLAHRTGVVRLLRRLPLFWKATICPERRLLRFAPTAEAAPVISKLQSKNSALMRRCGQFFRYMAARQRIHK